MKLKRILLLVGLCLVWCLVSCLRGLHEAELWREQTGLSNIKQVVVCNRDVPEGQIISTSDIYEREIEPYLIKPDNLLCMKYAIGKQAKYGLSAGQIVCSSDIGMNQEDLEKDELADLKQKRGEKIVVMCPHQLKKETPIIRK